MDVNAQARKERHQRVFAKTGSLRFSALAALVGNVLRFGIEKTQRVRSILTPYLHRKGTIHDRHTPTHKLFVRYSAVVAVLFLIGSYTPLNASYSDALTFSDSEGLWDGTNNTTTPLMADQEGYLTKINPQTSVGDRSSMNDFLVHTVASGENISTIAATYNLRTSTLLWANSIHDDTTLQVGQKLFVPPVDGVSYHVAKGDNIQKVAKTFNVNSDAIIKQNTLSSDGSLTTGDNIFIPGGKPLIADNVDSGTSTQASRTTPARVSSSSRVNSVATGDASTMDQSSDIPATGKPFIFPTHGEITQGFHAGHYAYDIANPDRPPIWAAGEGTVVKVVSGCADVSYRCGGGYGNHVIVDHGNGLETLYGHMTYPTVQVGDHVSQGEVIGKMGRSGNVRGVTGIHLHFEVHKNGVKEVPSNYY